MAKTKLKNETNGKLNKKQNCDKNFIKYKKILKSKKKLKTDETKNVTTIIKKPINAGEASQNWRILCQQLGSGSGKKKPISKNKTNVNNNKAKEEKIWFDVDKIFLEEKKLEPKVTEQNEETDPAANLVKEKSFTGLTKLVAMDCEMVGVGDGSDSILARVSIVNHFGHCVYDKFVKPTEKVTDYRTEFSGVRASDLETAEEFSVVQKEVADIIEGRILVGHSLKNDLNVLFLSHPKRNIRDTAKFFRYLYGGRTPALRKLSKQLLGVNVQSGEHNSIEDARAAMRLYTMHRKKWETQISKKFKRKRIPPTPKASTSQSSEVNVQKNKSKS